MCHLITTHLCEAQLKAITDGAENALNVLVADGAVSHLLPGVADHHHEHCSGGNEPLNLRYSVLALLVVSRRSSCTCESVCR